jgi:hypothetical protein
VAQPRRSKNGPDTGFLAGLAYDRFRFDLDGCCGAVSLNGSQQRPHGQAADMPQVDAQGGESRADDLHRPHRDQITKETSYNTGD